ncbi:MAG: ribose-phosphate pyrophosphokinase [Candidatus Omnitrophica bacterium]|nr:ribose-phosphate pyrophosphokinase [Candidatus Omnitrophota bacterium]
MDSDLAIFTGSANPGLAMEIAETMAGSTADALVGRFSEGEIRLKINENVRGKDVFVVQPTCSPVNDNLMELLIMMDALKRSSARRITAVIPYYGYARQDRKDQPRVPITAKLVANLITIAGASRVLTLDLHAQQIQGFFDIPVDHLYAVNVFAEHLHTLGLKNPVVVSPDVGGIKMARAYAKRLSAPLAVIDKRRLSPEKAEVMNLIGEVKGRPVVIVDDIVATAGSLLEACKALKENGAGDIYATITHPVLSGNALERLDEAPLKSLAVTNSIPLSEEKRKHPKIKQLSVAQLLGEAIHRIHNEESVSSLFD